MIVLHFLLHKYISGGVLVWRGGSITHAAAVCDLSDFLFWSLRWSTTEEGIFNMTRAPLIDGPEAPAVWSINQSTQQTTDSPRSNHGNSAVLKMLPNTLHCAPSCTAMITSTANSWWSWSITKCCDVARPARHSVCVCVCVWGGGGSMQSINQL